MALPTSPLDHLNSARQSICSVSSIMTASSADAIIPLSPPGRRGAVSADARLSSSTPTPQDPQWSDDEDDLVDTHFRGLSSVPLDQVDYDLILPRQAQPATCPFLHVLMIGNVNRLQGSPLLGQHTICQAYASVLRACKVPHGHLQRSPQSLLHLRGLPSIRCPPSLSVIRSPLKPSITRPSSYFVPLEKYRTTRCGKNCTRSL
jgi:hypothetical protein